MAVVLASFTVSPYYLLLLVSAALCTFLYGLRLEKIPGRGWLCAFLTLPMGIVLGTIFSRLLYLLCQLRYAVSLGFVKQLFSADITLWCFSGGAVGVLLAVWISAKCTGLNPHRVRARFAPVGALMAALVRFSEYFLVQDQIGIGPYMENEALHFFPLAVCIPEWEEYYLAVFFFEGITCLLVAGFSWFCFHHNHFLRTLFWLCLPQILWQSLLNQNMMWWFFLKVEQLFCVLICLGVLVYMCQRNRYFPPLWMGLGATAVIAFAEYALDKITAIPMLVTYGIMAAALVLMGVGGRICFQRDERFG